MPGTAFTDNNILNAMFGLATFPAVTNQYAALFYSSPNKIGAFSSELTACSNYSRITLTPLMSGSSVPGSSNTFGAIPNATDVLFGVASNAWGTVGYLGIVNTSVLGTGQIWAYASFNAPANVVAGNQIKIAASNLVFSCD